MIELTCIIIEPSDYLGSKKLKAETWDKIHHAALVITPNGIAKDRHGIPWLKKTIFPGLNKRQRLAGLLRKLARIIE